MPLGNTLPFGLRDVKLFAVTGAGVRTGLAIDLPVARTFSFKETVSSETLAGDDVTVASHDYDPIIEWELEAGGISLEAYAAIAGGTVTATGTTPAQVKKYSKLKTQTRPYFEVEGQAISDSGGDMHTVVYRCKADGDIEGSFENGSFYLTKAAGKGFGNLDTNQLYDFLQNESETDIDDGS
jgi:hypothetical protein